MSWLPNRHKQEKLYAFFNPNIFLKIKTKIGALLYLFWLPPSVVVFRGEQEHFCMSFWVCISFQLGGAARGKKLSYSTKYSNLLLKESLCFSVQHVTQVHVTVKDVSGFHEMAQSWNWKPWGFYSWLDFKPVIWPYTDHINLDFPKHLHFWAGSIDWSVAVSYKVRLVP